MIRQAATTLDRHLERRERLQHDKSDPGAVVPLVKELDARAHPDPTRPALATFYGATDGSVGVTDLVGFNAVDGWYVNTVAASRPA
jgi:hypothetical protein